MSFFFRILLAACVFAGMATGMVHQAHHDDNDECCHSQHETGNDHDKDSNQKGKTHHHDCCHFPQADRAMIAVALPCSFHTCLVEIPVDRTPAPDEPVFALDKPPLI
ncbi:MAG: hypothetical protein NWR51_10160 [Akkermansiaceae bacterium]|nr:hypothetical protein [Akkermansiaceae bacterium]MDP4847610.1 hypothetical protein [Akkermansiaceae bacterium]MDP4995758.1 hypothetical protein [Akkermansiaceae bacterium]